MEEAYLSKGMVSNHVHFEEGKGAVFEEGKGVVLQEDTLVLSDTVDMFPQQAEVGCSGKVPVDIRMTAHKVVEVQKCCLKGTEKLIPLQDPVDL